MLLRVTSNSLKYGVVGDGVKLLNYRLIESELQIRCRHFVEGLVSDGFATQADQVCFESVES